MKLERGGGGYPDILTVFILTPNKLPYTTMCKPHASRENKAYQEEMAYMMEDLEVFMPNPFCTKLRSDESPLISCALLPNKTLYEIFRFLTYMS
jgi:hypothetical protein